MAKNEIVLIYEIPHKIALQEKLNALRTRLTKAGHSVRFQNPGPFRPEFRRGDAVAVILVKGPDTANFDLIKDTYEKAKVPVYIPGEDDLTAFGPDDLKGKPPAKKSADKTPPPEGKK